MSDNERQQNGDRHFTVCLADDDQPHTIPRLLGHAIKILEESSGDSPIHIDEFFIDNSDNEGNPSITCAYWPLDPEIELLQSKNITWRAEHKVSGTVPAVSYFPKLDTPATLRLLEFRLPQGDDQWDGLHLIRMLADYLEQHDIKEILDLMLSNHLDDDAINHPFVRVYFKS